MTRKQTCNPGVTTQISCIQLGTIQYGRFINAKSTAQAQNKALINLLVGMWEHTGTNLQVQNMFWVVTVRRNCQTFFSRFLTVSVICFKQMYWCNFTACEISLLGQLQWSLCARSEKKLPKLNKKALRRASPNTPTESQLFLRAPKRWLQSRFCPCSLTARLLYLQVPASFLIWTTKLVPLIYFFHSLSAQ